MQHAQLDDSDIVWHSIQ